MRKYLLVSLITALLTFMSIGDGNARFSFSDTKHEFVHGNIHISHNFTARETVEGSAVSSSDILETAEDTLGDSSRHLAGNGRLACAEMVSNILNRCGVRDIDAISTSVMDQQLRRSSHFKRVAISEAQAGDIIISPTVRGKTGHVGIVGKHGQVYSNNSKAARFAQDFTINTWTRYFVSHRDLDVYVYRKI